MLISRKKQPIIPNSPLLIHNCCLERVDSAGCVQITSSRDCCLQKTLLVLQVAMYLHHRLVQIFANTRVLCMLVVVHWVSWDCQKLHKQQRLLFTEALLQCSWCSCFWWGIVLLIRKRLLFTETCWKLARLITISPVSGKLLVFYCASFWVTCTTSTFVSQYRERGVAEKKKRER